MSKGGSAQAAAAFLRPVTVRQSATPQSAKLSAVILCMGASEGKIWMSRMECMDQPANTNTPSTNDAVPAHKAIRRGQEGKNIKHRFGETRNTRASLIYFQYIYYKPSSTEGI